MLKGKTVYIPPMGYDSARVLAAAFRAVGLCAEPLPPSDERTREVSGRYASGDECLPFQILTGDVMKLFEGGDVDPGQSVFLLPASLGPCRFASFVPDLREILERSGYGQAEVFAPDLSNGHKDLGELGAGGIRIAWLALVSADILQKLLLLHRPYERVKGETDKAYEDALQDLCASIEFAPPLERVERILSSLFRDRDRFGTISMREECPTPLVGIVGEPFCRFNTLLNNDLIRQLEDRGGQAWLAGLLGEVRRYVRTFAGLEGKLSRDETVLMEVLRDDLATYSEPDTGEVLKYAQPYLPIESGSAEVVLRLGQVVHMARQGVDGIIDASPFPCMNGSACAAFYPKLSRDLGGLPIRNFYFHGVRRDWTAELDEYLGAVRAYREHKGEKRN